MFRMARRLPTFVVAAFSAALTLSVPTPCARADIGFAQAAATARMLNPGRTLVSLGHRITNNGAIYTTGCIDASCQLMYGVDINAANGFIVGVEVEAPLPPEDRAMRDVMDRIHLVNHGFEDALARARTATGRPDVLLERCDLASELFMIFYDLRYSDGLRLMVDAITGEVVPVVETAGSANSLTPVQYHSYLARAQDIAGAGWYPFVSETAVTQQGLAVGVTMLNPQSGRLMDIGMLGKQLDVVEFTPIGSLALKVAGVRSSIASTAVSAGQFMARIEHDLPGSRMSGFGLAGQFNNSVLRISWSAPVLTALNQPLEFAVDAMTPIDSSLGISSVPQHFAPGDYNRDGRVFGEDLAELLSMYNQQYPPLDLDGDGFVKGEDLAILLSNWG